MPVVLLLALALSSGGAKAAVGTKTLRGIDKIKVVFEDLICDFQSNALFSTAQCVCFFLAPAKTTQPGKAVLQVATEVTDWFNPALAGGPADFRFLNPGVSEDILRDQIELGVKADRNQVSKLRRVAPLPGAYSDLPGTLLTLILEDFLTDYQAVNPKR